MDRSEFFQIAVVGGLAVACGASKSKERKIETSATRAATGDPYDWKPGDPISINPVQKSDEKWKEILTDKQYFILREDGTEEAFNNPYWDNKKEGIYFCAGCALPLYNSPTKFKSGTGWPSFYQPIDPKVVKKVTDTSAGMVRGEIECTQCRGHLGHVFNDGPEPTGLRYCMNSYVLHFKAMKV